MKLPNMLTIFRILMVPVFMLFFYLPRPWGHEIAAGVFALAGVTDWLDGYLARRWNQTSQFGAFLDPVADKLLVVVAVILLVSRPYLHYLSFPAAIIAGRELVICAIREWMAEFGHKAKVKVLYIAKLKTGFQFVAIVLLILFSPNDWVWLKQIGYGLFYLAATLTLLTLAIYAKIALKAFRGTPQ